MGNIRYRYDTPVGGVRPVAMDYARYYSGGGPKRDKNYNTILTPEQEREYAAWVETLPLNLRSDYDYDLRGAWLNGDLPDRNYHMSDRWKKPWHATFSDESVYSGDGAVGGHWYGDRFEPSALNRYVGGFRYGSWGAESFGDGGGIHIKKENRGKFTAAAERAGKSVQAYASQILANKGNYSPTLVKRANFARNAAKWHAYGGNLYDAGGVASPDDPPRKVDFFAGMSPMSAGYSGPAVIVADNTQRIVPVAQKKVAVQQSLVDNNAAAVAKEVADTDARRLGYANAEDRAEKEAYAAAVAAHEADMGEIKPYDGVVTGRDRTPNVGIFAASTPQENRQAVLNLATTAAALTPGLSPFAMTYLGAEGVDNYYNAGYATAGGDGNVLTRFGNYVVSPEGIGNLAAMYFGAKSLPAALERYNKYIMSAKANKIIPMGGEGGIMSENDWRPATENLVAHTEKAFGKVGNAGQYALEKGTSDSFALPRPKELGKSGGRAIPLTEEAGKMVLKGGDTITTYEGPANGDYNKPYWWTRNYNIEFNPNYVYKKGTSEEIADTREWLKRANRYFRGAYDPIDLKLSEYPKKAEDAVKARLEQHNTFLRGVRDFKDDSRIPAKVKEKSYRRMAELGIPNTREGRIKFGMNYYVPENAHGRSGLYDKSLGALYTSNSLDTAIGYASLHDGTPIGEIGVVRRPYKLSGDRENWLTEGDFVMDRKFYANTNWPEIGRREYIKRNGKITPAYKEAQKEFNDLVQEKIAYISAKKSGINITPPINNPGKNVKLEKAAEDRAYDLVGAVKRLNDFLVDKHMGMFVHNYNPYYAEKVLAMYETNLGKYKTNLINKYGNRRAQQIWAHTKDSKIPSIMAKSLEQANNHKVKKKLSRDDIGIFKQVKESYLANYAKKFYKKSDVADNNVFTTEDQYVPKKDGNKYQHYNFVGKPGEKGLEFLGFLPKESWSDTKSGSGRMHVGGSDPRFSHKTRAVLPYILGTGAAGIKYDKDKYSSKKDKSK